MVDKHDVVKCPLCEGQGEVRRARLLECVRDQTLEIKLKATPRESMASPTTDLNWNKSEPAMVRNVTSKKRSTAGIRNCPCGVEAQRSDLLEQSEVHGCAPGPTGRSRPMSKGVELQTAALMDRGGYCYERRYADSVRDQNLGRLYGTSHDSGEDEESRRT